MPIPALNADGLLPAGVFDCTLPEVRVRFGAFRGSDHRARLFARLEELVLLMQSTVATASMNRTEAILTQTVEQLERLNEALAALHRELLPGQPKKFAILAEGPLEDMRRRQGEIERLTAEITGRRDVRGRDL